MSPKTSGPIGVVMAAAVAITSFGIQPAAAAPLYGAKAPAVTQAQPTLSPTPVSSRRYYRGRNNAAALGVFLGLAGGIAAIAASRHNRYGYYGNPYGYYGYGAPAPYGYYAAPYGYYPGRRW